VPASDATPAAPASPDASFARWVETKASWIVAVALLAALFWIVLYRHFTVDDAFISFRYGKNLVAHRVWNWNPSGTHEEAYTSFVYTALGIVPALLHLSPVLFFKFFGLGCIAAMVYRVRTVSTTPFAVLLGLLLIGLHPWTWLHAFSGLETPLYMLLLLEMAICVHRAAATPASWAYTLFLLLPLTRPEGIVFACVGVALFWSRRASAPGHFGAFAVTLLLGLLYFFVRWRYFHHLLPNPYYLKLAPSAGSSTWGEIRSYLIENLTEAKGYFLVLSLICAFARLRYTRIFALSGILLLLLLYAPHAMQMTYAERFYFQVAFPLLLFFLMTEDLPQIARMAAVAAAVCLFSVNFQFLRNGPRLFQFGVQSDIGLGRRLAPFAGNHTLLAGSSGAVPYYSNWTAYDFYGLGTYRIVHDGIGTPMLQELHPDLILIDGTESGLEAASAASTRGINSDRDVEIDFVLHSGEYDNVGATGTHGIGPLEFLRKTTPDHDRIARALQQLPQTSSPPPMPH